MATESDGFKLARAVENFRSEHPDWSGGEATAKVSGALQPFKVTSEMYRDGFSASVRVGGEQVASFEKSIEITGYTHGEWADWFAEQLAHGLRARPDFWVEAATASAAEKVGFAQFVSDPGTLREKTYATFAQFAQDPQNAGFIQWVVDHPEIFDEPGGS